MDEIEPVVMTGIDPDQAYNAGYRQGWADALATVRDRVRSMDGAPASRGVVAQFTADVRSEALGDVLAEVEALR